MDPPISGMAATAVESPTPAARSPWQAGLAAAKANRLPGLVLSVCAVGLLLAYWYVPSVQSALNAVADLKQRVGWPFVFVSTATFGAAIPWAVQRYRLGASGDGRWSHLWFLAAFWGYKGIEIELFYQAQAAVFGDDVRLGVVLTKMTIDTFVYMPLWAMPTTIIAYRFKDVDWSWARLRRWLSGPWYRRDTVPVLISNWCVWIPAVAVIYCLPLALQLPVQNLVLCFWSLILVLLAKPSEDE